MGHYQIVVYTIYVLLFTNETITSSSKTEVEIKNVKSKRSSIEVEFFMKDAACDSLLMKINVANNKESFNFYSSSKVLGKPGNNVVKFSSPGNFKNCSCEVKIIDRKGGLICQEIILVK